VPVAPPSSPSPPAEFRAPSRFHPRLTLLTLTRGEGLLGLRAVPGKPGFGPRGGQLTVARVDWTYARCEPGSGPPWSTPAPSSVLQPRPWPVPPHRDLGAEQQAADQLFATALRPLPSRSIQWRTPDAAAGFDNLWSLPEEAHYADFFAEVVPKLQAQGWTIAVQPGFAHFSVPVQRWRLVLDPATGAEASRELADPLGAPAQALSAMRHPPGQGSWLLSLGVEVEGELLDLAPLLADLIKRDGRWLQAEEIARIHDDTIITLRAPGGRRIEAPAKPLKAIVGAMVDLLTDPRRAAGPVPLSLWEAHRLEALHLQLDDTLAQRAGERGAWQVQGAAGVATLVQRLRAAGTPPAVPMPAGLGLTLRAYQEHGVAWLQYLRAQDLAGILADDMGLGKTAQVLAHLLIEKQAGRLQSPGGDVQPASGPSLPALVVLPTSLIANWEAEAARIAPALRTLTLQGAARAQDFGRIADHDVVFTTYPLLWRDIDALAAQDWHLLILDEAQMAKNAGSRTARALRQLRARHRLCVTGTPLENHLGELWAHFDLLMPGFLGDARTFTRQWRKPIEENGETLRAQLLAQRVRPFILRRRKDDVATELPPRTEVVRRVVLAGQQRALYESVRLAADQSVRKVLAKTSFAGAQIAVLDALLKLRQVCCDPQLVKNTQIPASMERAKMAALLDLLPALVDEGRRVLVYSQFTEMLALVQTELAAIHLPHLVLTGDTPPAARGAVVQRFQAREEPVLLVSLKAGGVGLNLTAADTVIHLDPWWNPAVEEQANARAHRIGQDKPVFVYKLLVQGSIEERMLALQARKSALSESVLGTDSAGAPKFSAEDLQGLLAPLD
jgi:superfamily II DNA or RNA helicase